MTRQLVWIDSVPPTRSNRPSCKHPEQLGLHSQGHLADFVEKERAAVGELEPALFLAVGSGKRSPFVTEQLALEQWLGQVPHN